MLVESLDVNAGILMSSVTDRLVNGRSASRYHASHTTFHSPQLRVAYFIHNSTTSQLREDQPRDHGLTLLPHTPHAVKWMALG